MHYASRYARIPSPPADGFLASKNWTSLPRLFASYKLNWGPSLATGPKGIVYRPIANDATRLIRILPGGRSVVSCEIIHYHFDEPLPYIAVSYAWGDSADTRRVIVDGDHHLVAVTLYGALEALRSQTSDVLVWADALCINQNDKKERGLQIQLMPRIYSCAKSVAIWLGPKENESTRAVKCIDEIASASGEDISEISSLLKTSAGNGDLIAVASLFRREYWRRLWVVQEIFYAKRISVYCGLTILPWESYQHASMVFKQHRKELATVNDDRERMYLPISPDHFNNEQTLIYQGPASIPNLNFQTSDKPEVLLHVLRTCRRKLALDPRDKLFGILGVLPDNIRQRFRVDYNIPVKDVYTGIVEFILRETGKLDIICEAIHFPIHTTNLPTFVPDWSHIPQTSTMGFRYGFSASGDSEANWRFRDRRRNNLDISAIKLDTVEEIGVAVGTLCVAGDYLMAFLQWRAIVLQSASAQTAQNLELLEDCLVATMCLGQIPESSDRHNWKIKCYHVVANLFRDRLPFINLDEVLGGYADMEVGIDPAMRRSFLQENLGDLMMGRRFCLTQNHTMAMGSGFMLPGDLIVVPLGCSTPILLRNEGMQDEYRYVGDIYVDGYMHGKAVEEWEEGKRELDSIYQANAKLERQLSMDPSYWIDFLDLIQMKKENIDIVVQLSVRKKLAAPFLSWGIQKSKKDFDSYTQVERIIETHAKRLAAQMQSSREAWISPSLLSIGQRRPNARDDAGWAILQAHTFNPSQDAGSYYRWDPVLYEWSCAVKEVTLFQASTTEDMEEIFGPGSHQDLSTPWNCLSLNPTVGEALSKGLITIVPDIELDPAPSRLVQNDERFREWERMPVKNYKLMVLSKCSKDVTARNFIKDQHGIRTLLGLHERRLQFKTDFRPKAKYVWWAFMFSVLKRSWRQDQEEKVSFKQEVSEAARYWRNQNDYIEKNQVVGLLEEFGHDVGSNLPVGSEKDSCDEAGGGGTSYRAAAALVYQLIDTEMPRERYVEDEETDIDDGCL
ncbi:hypothetical protein FGRMN_990 [Fusarium graminum]|nr:hypothetical protein FGRMN_990 [Fusarium graminum]